jgi:RNA polymerase sigma-70 factor, ECF subfamily
MMADETPGEEARNADFARVVRTHRPKLLRYALRRLEDGHSVEDAVAETFVVAWRRWAEKPPDHEELFWLYGIERLVLSNAQRSQRRRLRLYGRLAWEREDESDAPRFTESDVEALVQRMELLDEDDRELLRLAYWERLTHRGIGLVVGCTENAAEIRLRRARGRLRDGLSARSSQVSHLRQGNKEMEL